MTQVFFEAISQISQFFSGANSNNCINQIQNPYLQEIISSCPNFQQLPILQMKEIQQFQTTSIAQLKSNITPRGKFSTLIFFSNISPTLSEILLSFLSIFETKIPLFDKKTNQEVQFVFSKLKDLSDLNLNKISISGNKENANSNIHSSTNLAFPQVESDAISKVALSSFLSFIHSFFKYKNKIENKSNENENNDNDDNFYYFDTSVYSVLFNLLFLAVQLNPSKGQIIDSLKLAIIILFEIFITESFKQYNIVYPPPKKNLSRIVSSSQSNDDETIQEGSKENEKTDQINTQNSDQISIENETKEKATFDKEGFCSILNNFYILTSTNSSLFFPGLDNLFVAVVKYINSDHRPELHFYDRKIMLFIANIALRVRATTFSAEAAHNLILLASNQLLKFDIDSLNYFIALSKHNDDSSNAQIVKMLANSLTIELSKERITNIETDVIKLSSRINKERENSMKNDEKLNTTDLFPPKEIFSKCFSKPDTMKIIDIIIRNYLYTSETLYTADDDFTPLVPIVQEGYPTLVSKRIYQIIQILSETFRRSNAMIDQLYTTFGKLIEKSSNIFNSLCLFVVFYLESKIKFNFEPSVNPSEFLLLQHLFSKEILPKKGTIVQRLQIFVIGILIDKSEKSLLKILWSVANSYKNNSTPKDDKTNEKEKNVIPACPLFVFQFLEGLIVNYKKIIILLTNSSDLMLEPLSLIMDRMKEISYDMNYVNYYNIAYSDISNNSKNELKNDDGEKLVLERDIDRVRYAFLILTSLISQNNEVKKILIDNTSFTKTFLDFILEGNKVRDYILSQIENALTMSKCDPSIAFIPNIVKLFEFVYQTKLNNDSDYLDKEFCLCKDILSMINHSLSVRKDLCKCFSCCSSIIFKLFIFIQEATNQLNYNNTNSFSNNIPLLKELIDFLGKISLNLKIDNNNKNIIKNAIESIYPIITEPLPDWLYHLLIKLMVPDEKLIRQPILLHLIFDYFNNDEYLQYICDLMYNNTYNVNKCCSVSFDKTIFQLLISDPSNFRNKSIIKQLFTNIALVAISPSVVYQYIKLLSPKDGFHLNKDMDLHLNYLNELLMLSLETQHESWALNPGHCQKPVSINLCPNQLLTNSSPKRSMNCFGDGYFTLVFWLIVTEMSPTYFPLIFKAMDENDNIYEVFIKGRKICFNYDKMHIKSSHSFNYTFNEDQWYFVSLSFSKQNIDDNQNSANIIMTVNEEKLEFNFPSNYMITGNSTFVFGGVLHEYSIASSNPCLLGPFALFNMTLRSDKIQSLYKQEQRFFCRDIKEPSLCHLYQPYEYGPRQMQKNFASTIVLNLKLDVFIPLFLLIPMKFESGEIYKNYVEVIIDILKHGLNFGSTIEDSFYNCNGFGIIGFILSQSKYHIYCDYNLYSQFYSLFLNLMTEKLKTEMIKNILLNFDLWSKIEKPDEIVLIFDNWLNALFPNNLQSISKIFSFSYLLNSIIFNFCPKEDESLIKVQYELPQLSKTFLSLPNEEIKVSKEKLNESQLQTINDILFQILLFYSVQKFTFEDYSLLVSYLSSSKSIDLILNIKKLLMQMIILKPSPLEAVFEKKSALSQLHQVFIKSRSIDAIESTIEIIIFLHKASMIHGNQIISSTIANASSYTFSLSNSNSSSSANFYDNFYASSVKSSNLQFFSLTDHLYTINQQIPKEIFNQTEFLNRLINLTEKVSPENFPFACWSALCIISNNNIIQTKEERRQMLFSILNNIEPSHDYIMPHWCFNPLFLVIKANDKTFSNKMINFIVECCKGDEWVGPYFTLSILCKVTHVNPIKFQRIFLQKILTDSINKKNRVVNPLLIKIISSYLFYRDVEYYNIGKFFNDSPFKSTSKAQNNNNNKSDKNSISSFSIDSICEFLTQISQTDLSSLKTIGYFGLKYHKLTGNWIDRDIAILLLKYIPNANINDSFYCFKLILIYFILHQNDDPKFVLSIIKDLDKPEFPNSNNTNFNSSFGRYLNNSYENLHLKRQDVIQILIDLVCFQIEKIGMENYCPLFKKHSDNFRVNGYQFFSIVSFTFNTDLYEYFFCKNALFSKRIQDISHEILDSSSNKICIPPFISTYDQQQLVALRPFFDLSNLPKSDSINTFEISQVETIIKKINDMFKFKHLFKDLFESLITTNAPMSSLNRFKKDGKYLHMKRDKTLVSQLIPLRMKTSWLFNDHKNINSENRNLNINSVNINSPNEKVANLQSNEKANEKVPETQSNEKVSAAASTEKVADATTNKKVDKSSDAGKHFSKIPSLSQNGDASEKLPVMPPGAKIRRISSVMKKRLMLSSSNCFVLIETECLKKNCEIVSIDKTEDAFLTITQNEIKLLKLKNFKLIRVFFSEMKKLTKTTYLHKPISIQIITTNGSEFFLNFQTKDNRDAIFSFISSHLSSRAASFSDIENFTKLWLDQKITNFEYLILVNMAGGRSFQNSSQYPIFPFVLRIYNLETPKELTPYNSSLILSDPKVYRNLSKPSGALDQNKFELLKKNQSILKKLSTNQGANDAFLFSTGASTPQILYGELARIEPFLSLYIALQGGKISNNNSLLSSIPSMYESVLHDSTDFRELLPEFFMLSPEFLEEPQGDIEKELNFGSVLLPPWFNSFDSIHCNIPAEFIYLHRKALESNFVRAHLNNWIDLIFGVNQRTDDNIYQNSLYEDAWNSRTAEEKNQLSRSKSKRLQKKKQETSVQPSSLISAEDVAKLKELEASKRVIGQVPLKVFSRPHPQCSSVIPSSHSKPPLCMSQEREMSSSKNLLSSTNPPESHDNRRSSLNHKNSAQLKFNKSMSHSIIQVPLIPQSLPSDNQKDEESLDANESQKKLETPDEKLLKKQQSKLRQIRDSYFDIRRVDLKKSNLIFATIFSATKKTLKVHSLDKDGNRIIFYVDSNSLNIIYSKIFTDELRSANFKRSQSPAGPKTNPSQSNVESPISSIISIASFRDCLFVVMKDKSLLLSSDGDIAVNGSYVNSKVTNSVNNSHESSYNFFHNKKYINVAYDSKSLVAIGMDSIIDLYKMKDSRIKIEDYVPNKVNPNSSDVEENIPLSNKATSASANEDSKTIVSSCSTIDLELLHMTNQKEDSSNLFFSDTLLMMKSPRRSFHFFSEYKVTCLAVSTSLNSFAVASNDGTVLLYSLLKGSTIIEVNLPNGFIGRKIIFTKGLGLVVVDAVKDNESKSSSFISDDESVNNNENEKYANNCDIHSLFVYTLNGELIRRRAISCGDSGISQLASFTSNKGIDYIALVTDSDNALHVCEAFLLDFENYNPPNINNSKQQEPVVNKKADNAEIKGKKSKNTSLLAFGFESSSCSSFVDDEATIKSQLSIPFPSLFKFDDHLVYLAYKRKLASLLYISCNGELGQIPVNRLIKENF